MAEQVLTRHQFRVLGKWNFPVTRVGNSWFILFVKRRTLRKHLARAQQEHHHNVYVVLLNPAVAKIRAVRAENPDWSRQQALCLCRHDGTDAGRKVRKPQSRGSKPRQLSGVWRSTSAAVV